MTDFDKQQPLNPMAWEGFEPTFRLALDWMMRNTTLTDAKARVEKIRNDFVGGGSGLAPTVPDLTVGGDMVLYALDLADFAAKEMYLRRMRRASAQLPSVMTFFERLINSPLTSEKEAGALLGTIIVAEQQGVLLTENPGLYDDPAKLVLAEIKAWRELDPTSGIQHLLGINPKLTDSIRNEWPQQGNAASDRCKDTISQLFRFVEDAMRQYR